MTILVTLEVHSPGGNDSVSFVPVRSCKNQYYKIKSFVKISPKNLSSGNPAHSTSIRSHNEKEDRSHPHPSPPTIPHPSKYVYTVLKMAENGGDGDEKVEKLG